ncbi:hypothetical protein AAFF_G00307600 [Aldrovandia affinis]|uniref:Protein FAM221A n=1 Tax=Aldrovandia affinis TaxID=143900 RepID=A0AAD7W0U9_9TELE|nr:hypothetical protein AAFF_G00307600 [Aldrovandia affinis]
MERLYFDRDASAAVDEYLEYRRIVGEDDGGRTFTPEEYEEYKRKVLPRRLRNRLYVSCGVPGGIDCKLIGPETLCFCSHRYKQHKTDFEELPLERPLALPCQVGGAGSTCPGFHSPFTCGCGQPSHAHETLVETREERLARGRPVGRDVPYKAMGGLTGFSSLADGYMRLDPSGIESERCEPGAAQGSGSSLRTGSLLQTAGGSSPAERVMDFRTREEQDMAYYEKRYQERLKMERAARQKASSQSKGKMASGGSYRK